MSRPSITTPPPSPSARCRATSTSRTCGRGLVHLGRTNVVGDVVAVDRDEAALDHELRALRQGRDRRLVVERDRVAQCLPADRTIHGAGIDVAEPENVGDSTGNGTLAGPGR